MKEKGTREILFSECGKLTINFLYKIFIALIIVSIVMPFIPNFSMADDTYIVDGVTASLSTDGTLIISGTGEIPRELIKKFDYEKTINKVIINDGITSIGEQCFSYCNELQSIEIPNSVTKIKFSAFLSCKKLESIKIPNGVTSIEMSTFEFCKNLVNVVLPSTIKSIESSAFTGCSSLVRIEIPESVEEIDEAFELCSSLKEININEANTNYCSENGIVFNKNKTYIICYPAGKSEKEYQIPDGIEIIGPYAFATCENLNSIIIPNSVHSIRAAAFIRCSNLKNISISDNITNIKYRAFESCKSLTEISIPEKVEYIDHIAFGFCDNLKKVTIYNSNIELDENIFFSCSSDLTIYGYENSTAQTYANENSIKFAIIGTEEPTEPEEDEDRITKNGITYLLNKENKTATVKAVSSTAISTDGKLFIPDTVVSNSSITYTVTKIASMAVQIEGIQSIRLPESLITIENSAFTKYTGEVYIPKNVSEFDINAFVTHEVDLKFDEENPTYFIGQYMELYSPAGRPSIINGFVKNSDNESSVYTVRETITEIGDRAFKYCSNYKKIKIGTQVKNIGYNAFEGIENDVTIQGYTGSYAEQYANEHNITFESIGDVPYFKFAQDNYSFPNTSEHFSSYEIGDFEKYLSNTLLEEYKDKNKNKEWSGSCFGMASTAIIFRCGNSHQYYWETENKTAQYTYDLTSPSKNKRLKWLINTYQFLQSYLRNGCFEAINSDFLEFSIENKIEDFYDAVENYYEEQGKGILLCGYNYGKDNGHAVVITDKPEEIDSRFYIERGWEYNNYNYYGHRIPIYNVSDSVDQEYIYIKEDFSGIAIGTNDYISDKFEATGDGTSSDSNNSLTRIIAYKLNNNNLFSLEYVIKYGEKYDFDSLFSDDYYIEYKNATPIKITNKEEKYKKIEDLNKVEGTLECKVEPIFSATSDDGNSEKITDVDAIVKADDIYSVETLNDTDKLDTSIISKDSYMSAKTTAGGKATFENKKAVTLENPTGGEYETKLTLNEEYVTLPWYTITTFGTGAKEIKTQMTEDGVLVTGDNLENLTVTGNNDTEETTLNVNTNKNKILIKANDTLKYLVAYVDNDNNGTYETPIGEGTEQSGKEIEKNDSDKETEKETNQGDTGSNSEKTGKAENQSDKTNPKSTSKTGTTNKSSESTSLSNKELPYTGNSMWFGALIIATSAVGIISFIKYRKYKEV